MNKKELELLKNLFKSLVWDNLVKTAISKVFIAVPFLALGPLGKLTSWLLTKFAKKLYLQFEEVVDLKHIVYLNKDLRKEFDRASVKLKILAREVGIESNEFKKARKEHEKQLAAFVHFNI